MTPHNLLQPLHDLDRASPQFYEQLVDFLRGNWYRDVVPGLQNEDLAWLVEYLDNVSLRTTSPRFTLNDGIGSLRYLRYRQCLVSEITARTQKDMRRQGGASEIVHDFGFSSGMCVRGDL